MIYDISNKQQIPILYFNPILEDSRFPGKFLWAYPNDIKDLIVNENKEIKVSLNNNYQREDNHIQPENQKELPFVFFKGITSQPDMILSSINRPEIMTVQSVIGKVKKNKETQVNNKPISIINNWQKDNIDINISKDNITYIFHGQCVYAFPVKIINDNEVELIWGYIGRDCVYEVLFEETFDLPKEKIPQKGKPFSKYTIENNVVKVTYYYNEWLEKYRKKMKENDKPFPFLNSFSLKTE